MENHLNEVLHEHLKKHDIYLDDEELEAINTSIIQEYKNDQNWGIMLERHQFNPREKAFAETWHDDNKIKVWVNNGYGLLQDLFIDRDKFSHKRFLYRITVNDRAIVATVIQWLGSNIGMDFLERALKKAGYKLEKIT
jgi:hypothetical protein